MSVVIGDPVTDRALTGKFQAALTAYRARWELFAMRVGSTGASEKFGWLGPPDVMREKTDENKRRGLPANTQTVTNLDWEAAIAVDPNCMKDDRWDLIDPQIQNLAVRAGDWPFEQLVNLLNIGDVTNCYDGQYFYDDDHKDLEAPYQTNQDNDLTYNCTDHTAPTVAELIAAFRQARKTMYGFKDPWGNPFHRGEPKLVTVCAAHLGNSFEEVFNATTISNTTNVLKGASELIVTPLVDSDVEFHVLRSDEVFKGLIYQDREKPRFWALGLDSEHCKLNNECLFATESRGAFAYGDWRNAVLTTLN